MDPLGWRNLEDPFAGRSKPFDLSSEALNTPLGIYKRLAESFAVTPLGYRLDEVVKATLLGSQLRLSELHGLWKG